MSCPQHFLQSLVCMSLFEVGVQKGDVDQFAQERAARACSFGDCRWLPCVANSDVDARSPCALQRWQGQVQREVQPCAFGVAPVVARVVLQYIEFPSFTFGCIRAIEVWCYPVVAPPPYWYISDMCIRILVHWISKLTEAISSISWHYYYIY